MSDSVAKSAIAAAPERRTWVGVIIALAAAAAFALANTSASVAYHGGSNALTVAATRFIVPAAALVVWTRISGIPLRLAKRDALAAASLGVVTALYNWAILRAFSSIPFALAVLIRYLFPLMAAAIVAGLGWEKLAWRTIAAVVVAFAGLGWHPMCATAISTSKASHWPFLPPSGWPSSSPFPAASFARSMRGR